MSINVGRRNFKIIKKIGNGAFGEVLKVSSHSPYGNYEDYWALKKIPLNGKSKEEIENCLKEVENMEKLNSDFIVRCFESSIEQNYLHILMGYHGDNLKKFIQRYKEKEMFIDEKIIKKIIRQICLGLREIHKANMIHRDLTPENIFIDENKDITIGDFGVSKILDSNAKYAKTCTGKLHYNAPEIEKGEKYTNKVDIYAFGCIIYELFTLNEYFLDKFDGKKLKIDTDIYNQKWQDLIDSLCQNDYHKRPSIEEIYEKLKNIDSKGMNKKIKIILKSIKGYSLEMFCNSDITIGELKDEIIFQRGFNHSEVYAMKYDGVVLNRDKTLEFYEIEDGDVIVFSGQLCG